MTSERLENLWQLIRQIPVGEVRSYGDLGRDLNNPTSGRIVGRWMSFCPESVPWWRVVAADGRMPLVKGDAHRGELQKTLLLDEGVSIAEFRVDMAAHRI